MKRILFLLYFIIHSAIISVGQVDQGYLEVRGTIKYEREALADAKVSIIKDGLKDKVYSTDLEGKFSARLDLNCVYELVFSKQGYFSKKLVFTTKVPAEDIGFWNYKFAVELIPEIEGFDASLFDEPIGKFEFNDDVGDFDYDLVYTNNMQKRIKALMLEYEKAKRESFKKLIAQADQAFNEKNYDLAIQLYDKASDLDPYDPYPEDQITMIGNIQKQDLNADKNYEKNVKEGDQYFQQKDYVNAKNAYNRALKYRDKQYPKDQLAAIEKLMVNPESDPNLLAYKNAIIAADQAYTTKQYIAAHAKYTEATGLKPSEQYPKDKIAELNKILAQLENDKKAKEELDKAYLAAITLADEGFKQKDLVNARNNYVKASSIKPAETYPKTKISEIDNLLAANKSLDEKYKGFITVADQSFTAKEYESAKGYYQQALTLKPNESYPASKIKEIDLLLLQLADSRKKDLESNYQKAIAAADAAFNKKEYDLAKTSYNQALTLKSNEVYPKQKIAEIDKILTDIAAKRRAYDLAIARADNSYNIEKWNEAKTAYQEALNLFPTEQYPQSRINEIDNKLLAMKGAAEQKAAREKAYMEAIAKADSNFNSKKYVESKNYYSQALTVKPNEAYPKNRLDEIDLLLAAEKALNEKYNSLIATADQNFINEKLQDSKTGYTSALQLKPNEEYPKKRIAEIDAKLGLIAANKQKSDQLKKQYDGLILQADQQYTAKNWSQAKSFYQQASTVLPDEVYPKERISEIDNLLAGAVETDRKYKEAIQNGDVKAAGKQYDEALASYNQAVQLKPNETYPKQKIAEINGLLAAQKKTEADYTNFIKIADAAFSSKQYVDAKTNYKSASELKPTESYPIQRINEIDKILAEQLRLKSDKEKLDAQYNTLISSADALLAQKKYSDAKSSYTQASLLKPEMTYPKEKISEIDMLLNSMAAQQKAYDQKMQEANTFFAAKNYNGALQAYQQASGLKPDEALPMQKIVEVQAIIADIAKKQQQYQQMITQADLAFNQKKYQEAKPLYQNAGQMFPNEQYPKSQLVLIDQLLAEAAKKELELQAKVKAYNAKIAEADKLFALKDYTNAMSSYSSAKDIKPDETYPDQQIVRINNLIKEDAAKLEASYNQAIQKGDQLKSQKSYVEAKDQYTIALNIKPKDPVAQSKLVEIQNLIDLQKMDKEKQDKINKDYSNFITQADQLFKLNEYSSAISVYKNAIALKPNENYPKDQISLCERKLQEQKALADAEAEKKRKADLEASQKSFASKDFDYSGEQRDSKFLNELAKLYPPGVTIENYERPNKKIKRVIVNRGGIAKEYIEVTYPYGTYYFRNGQNISRSIFYTETKE